MVTDEQKCVCKAFDHKRYQWYEFEDFTPQLPEKMLPV